MIKNPELHSNLSKIPQSSEIHLIRCVLQQVSPLGAMSQLLKQRYRVPSHTFYKQSSIYSINPL
uniref:Uncharacterized protein n=1 Tax=Anguilla anguilla TaxID=7936 RepID=A0A0E9WPK7_ANGAN